MKTANQTLLEQALSNGTAMVLLLGAALALIGMAAHKRMWVELGLGGMLLVSIIAGFWFMPESPLVLPGFAAAITVAYQGTRAYQRAPAPTKKEPEPPGMPGGGEGES